MLRFVSFSLCFILLSSLIIGSSAFYSKKDDVVELTTSNFPSEVLKSGDVWLVEFYAPWCGHCKSLTPEYKKAATKLKGIAKVGAVDMTKHESFGRQYDIKGFPTIKLFIKGKPLDYQGGRTADAMVDYVKREVAAQQNVKSSKSSSDKKDSSSSSSKKSKKSSDDSKAKVFDLTESTFDSLVFDSEDLWLVEFFAPWCGHCKNLAPHWEKAAKELGGVAKLGAVDATIYTNLASKYGVKGYPTIKVFKPGKRDPEDYQGGRTSSDIVTYAKNIAQTLTKPKPRQITEISSSKDFDDVCSESTCIIAVLPHILDSQASGRNNYISTLKSVSLTNSRQPFEFAWMEIGAQPELENLLTQEFGGIAFPPAVIAVNVKKGRHVMMTGAFSENGINRFINGIVTGSERTVELANKNFASVITKKAKWDGKDAEIPAAETESENDSNSEREL